MVVAELFAMFGLKTDAASFAKGALAADGVKFALNKLAEAARFVGAELRSATLGVYEQADNLDDLAAKTGVSVAALQQLGYAGSFADVSMESLATSLRILQRNMVGAIEGNVELKKSFKAVGVSLVDESGHVRSTEDVFTDLADAFARMPTTAARTTAAMKIFGKSGADLLPLLAQGGAGIRAATAEFRALGGELDDGFIAQSAELQDNLLRLKTGFQGVKNTIAAELLPVFSEITDSALTWVKANRALISSKIKEWIGDIVATAKYWIATIREWVKEQGGLDAVLEKAGHALKLFLVYMAVKEVLGFVQALLEIPKALGVIRAAIAANPIGLLITLLALLAVAVYENWEDVKAFFTEGLNYIEDALHEMFDAFDDWVDSIGDALREFGGWLYGLFVQPWVTAGEQIKAFFVGLFDWIVAKLEWVGAKVGGLLDKINPFSVNDTSSSGTRGVAQQSPLLDRISAISRDPSLALDPGRGSGASVTITSPVTINATQLPGQSSTEFARVVADEIEKDRKRTMREAGGGLL